MSKRFLNAHTAQSGACNPRPISQALRDAIFDCYECGVPPENDPAVFLILHQLVYILTGHDFSFNAAMSTRWDQATKEVEAHLDAQLQGSK
jgi:hypothetical protein